MELQNKTLSNLGVIFSEFIPVQFPGPDALFDAVVVGVHYSSSFGLVAQYQTKFAIDTPSEKLANAIDTT